MLFLLNYAYNYASTIYQSLGVTGLQQRQHL